MAGLADCASLLAAWESAAAAPEVARAAVVLAHDLGRPIDEVLDLPLAECAQLSLISGMEAFSEFVNVSCACAACGEVVEARLGLKDFRSGPVPEQVTIESGATLVVRALTTRDLLAVRTAADPAASLRRRMLSRPDPELSEADFAELTAAGTATLDAAAEDLAGNASVLLRVQCPCCGADFAASLDPGELLWERVAAAAVPLLAQVATLARAFGWSEREVLGLTEQRRRAYLELVGEPARQGPGG